MTDPLSAGHARDIRPRTARALEAFMLQPVGLRDTLFIAMSSLYYEHKVRYINTLNDTRAAGHDLTPFLK
jgi:hypothetical protein